MKGKIAIVITLLSMACILGMLLIAVFSEETLDFANSLLPDYEGVCQEIILCNDLCTVWDPDNQKQVFWNVAESNEMKVLAIEYGLTITPANPNKPLPILTKDKFFDCRGKDE